MLSSRKRARVNCGKPENSTGSMVQLVYSAGPVVRIALLIVLDHCSVYIGIRHADHGAGWSGCQKLGFRVFFVMENDKIKNHTEKDSF